MTQDHSVKTPEQIWLEERKTGIGGSDAAAVIGMSPYKTNVDLFRIKTGLKVDTVSSNNAMKYGKAAEKPLYDLFVLDYPQYECSREEYKIKRHKDYPFILGTLDGELIERDTGRRGVLEIKTTEILKSSHREKWDNRIPDNYFIQVLHYLIVTEYDFAVLKAQLKTKWIDANGREEVRCNIRHYHLERNDFLADIDLLLREEIKFWNEYVIPRKEPNLILPNI